ncbi:hypothetical protein [Bacillus sp. OK048]|uniref:hypothetical protein n=1 Tax=Bacillus sp. OK048 TaxID=1882761 RepID=UPI000886D7B0|nr:hypothetical protein [Bacillus sp. OK048]SDN01573.1 hypothetical protein SAMN05443253_107160 [Bacillus sp. OK048]
MKTSYMLLLLIILAWPLYFLYQHQLGAISFLILAVIFFMKAMSEMKKLKEEKKPSDNQRDSEKIK